MNKLIQNLAQISDAAEYFDKKTGAAWKIRAALTNMVVWACNGLLYAKKSDNAERMAKSMVEVATIRSWVHDCNCNALVLDFTPAAVRKTLGLERTIDAHVEACRVARQKCLQTRSAMNFRKFYDKALDSLDEQRRTREEAVDTIAELICDEGFLVQPSVLTVMLEGMQLQLTNITPGKDTDKRYIDDVARECHLGVDGRWVTDVDLYDDDAVERQADRLAEVVGNCLESMYDQCQVELTAAITANKVSRLEGYQRAISNMLIITGVDMAKLAQRRVKLEQLIDAQAKSAAGDAEKVDADIEAQIAALGEARDTAVETIDAALSDTQPLKNKRMRRVKKEDLAKELAA